MQEPECILSTALKRCSVKMFLEEAVNAYTPLPCNRLRSSWPARLLRMSLVLRSWDSERPTRLREVNQEVWMPM